MIKQEETSTSGQPESYAQLVERLQAVPESIQRLIAGRSADELRQPGQDAGLGVVEILCDQQDWEEITGERVARILHEDVPELESYDDSLWSIEHDYASRDSEDVVEAFATLRARLIETLSELDDAGWQRKANLRDHGEVTLAWLIERVLHHDEQHIAEIMEALV